MFPKSVRGCQRSKVVDFAHAVRPCKATLLSRVCRMLWIVGAFLTFWVPDFLPSTCKRWLFYHAVWNMKCWYRISFKSLDCSGEDSWNILLKGFQFLRLKSSILLYSHIRHLFLHILPGREQTPSFFQTLLSLLKQGKFILHPMWEQLIFKMLPFPKALPSWKWNIILYWAPYGVCEEWTRRCSLIKALKFVMRNGSHRWFWLGVCVGRHPREWVKW